MSINIAQQPNDTHFNLKTGYGGLLHSESIKTHPSVLPSVQTDALVDSSPKNHPNILPTVHRDIQQNILPEIQLGTIQHNQSIHPDIYKPTHQDTITTKLPEIAGTYEAPVKHPSILPELHQKTHTDPHEQRHSRAESNKDSNTLADAIQNVQLKHPETCLPHPSIFPDNPNSHLERYQSIHPDVYRSVNLDITQIHPNILYETTTKPTNQNIHPGIYKNAYTDITQAHPDLFHNNSEPSPLQVAILQAELKHPDEHEKSQRDVNTDQDVYPLKEAIQNVHLKHPDDYQYTHSDSHQQRPFSYVHHSDTQNAVPLKEATQNVHIQPDDHQLLHQNSQPCPYPAHLELHQHSQPCPYHAHSYGFHHQHSAPSPRSHQHTPLKEAIQNVPDNNQKTHTYTRRQPDYLIPPEGYETSTLTHTHFSTRQPDYLFPPEAYETSTQTETQDRHRILKFIKKFV